MISLLTASLFIEPFETSSQLGSPKFSPSGFLAMSYFPPHVFVVPTVHLPPFPANESPYTVNSTDTVISSFSGFAVASNSRVYIGGFEPASCLNSRRFSETSHVYVVIPELLFFELVYFPGRVPRRTMS